MDTILVYYQEITHTDPTGWERVEEYRVSSAVDGWLMEHPDGFVRAMREDTFRRTIYGKAMLAREKRDS